MQNPDKWRSKSAAACKDQEGREAAHMKASEAVCRVVEQDVICDQKIVKLSDLLMIYISCLEETKYKNPQYRSGKLKSKLQAYEPFQCQVSFCEIENFQPCILFNSEMDINTAVKKAFELGRTDIIAAAGTFDRLSLMNLVKLRS